MVGNKTRLKNSGRTLISIKSNILIPWYIFLKKKESFYECKFANLGRSMSCICLFLLNPLYYVFLLVFYEFTLIWKTNTNCFQMYYDSLQNLLHLLLRRPNDSFGICPERETFLRFCLFFKIKGFHATRSNVWIT